MNPLVARSISAALPGDRQERSFRDSPRSLWAWFALVLGILVAAAAPIWFFMGQSPKAELTVALDPNPPFLMWGEDGAATGAIPDLLNVAAARAGIGMRWVEFNRAPEHALKPGTGIDLWPLLQRSDEREGRFHMTQPYARAETLLVIAAERQGKPIQRLGVGYRSSARRWASRAFPHVAHLKPEDIGGMLSLCANQLDATLVETPAFDTFLMNQPPSCSNFRFDATVIPELNTNYTMGSTFEAAATADLLRQHLGEMARDGTLDEIFQKYYPLAHYRSAETFAETETERSARLFRWSATGMLALCAVLWIALQRFRREAGAAREMADLRTRFLTNISHELRTPLNGVLGLASALGSTSLDRTQREYLGLIRSSGEILLHTVNDVLDFSRLEAGKQTVTLVPVAVEDLVEGVVSLLAPVAQQKDLELAWVVEEPVPHAILSDRAALRQILVNLIGNGLKFTERGMVYVRVSCLGQGHEPKLLRIEVSDSGPGIPDGEEESVFDPFVRGTDTRTQVITGTGLGLTITKQLVLMLGGRIRAENQPAGGCAFLVELPFESPREKPSAEAAARHRSFPIPRSALVLTRQPITAAMLARRLRGYGCEVTVEQTIEASLVSFEPPIPSREARTRRDLLVIDDAIEADCLDVAIRLKQLQPGPPPTVILLATGAKSAKALAARVPADFLVLSKPFLTEFFCSALETATQRASAAPPIGITHSSSSNRPLPQLDGNLEILKKNLSMAGCPNGRSSCDQCLRDNKGVLVQCLATVDSAGVPPVALVADDNPVNRKVIVSLLKTLGVACLAVESGEEAIASFNERTYSWVVMDWHMPGIDGLTAIGRIREVEAENQTARTPVILCSASSEQDHRVIRNGEKINAMLPKPITVQSLRQALMASLCGARSHRADSAAARPPHQESIGTQHAVS